MRAHRATEGSAGIYQGTGSGKGISPSVREIGEAVGLRSSSTVHGHLRRLESKGYIRRDPLNPGQ